MVIPTEKELLEFISTSEFINFSKIAKKFGIKNDAVSDFLKPLIQRRSAKVVRIGANKFVRVKK